MKSFADWTQDLAESVGPVEHHWETRKDAELKGVDPYNQTIDGKALCDILSGDTGAIQPNWQSPGGIPGAPTTAPCPPIPGPAPTAVAYDKCDYCNVENYLFPTTSLYGTTRHICKKCLDYYGP